MTLTAIKAIEQYAIALLFWFGNSIIYLLEWIVPTFKDRKQNEYALKDVYLDPLKISKQESHKQNAKIGIRIYFSLLFWLFALYAIPEWIQTGIQPTTLYFFLLLSASLVIAFMVIVQIKLERQAPKKP